MSRAAAAWLLVTLVASNPGPPPRDAVREMIDRVVAVVDVKREEPASTRLQEQQRIQLRRIMDEMVDVPEMARRALGRHWLDRTLSERRQFVELFRTTLEDAHVAQLQAYAGQPIEFVGRAVEGGRATIRSLVVSDSGKTGVDYRLRLDEGRWRIVDVVIDGVSVVATYRKHFDAHIQSGSYASLLERLRGQQRAISLPGTSVPAR